jgi:nucleoid-associated protein YgaU
MSRIVAAFRFLFGVALVAGGAALAAPTFTALVQEVARHRQAMAALPSLPQPAGASPDWQSPAAPTLAMQPPAAAWPPVDDATVPTGSPPPNPHYQPPPPPAPLPPLPHEFNAGGPDVATAYRSTLQVPPPPLLDAHRPPPLAAGWTAHDVAAPAVAVMPDAVVPQAYVVRDGDDLTGIATRFYGHASAATAIWAANRDALPDPNVLPIGAVLRLPPAWTVFAARGGDPRAIEPQATLGPGAVAPAAESYTTARPVAWLAGDAAAAASPAAVRQPPVPPRPARVRVAPGETLASLARRFYGDERAAGRIWEANRDRLRSPELVVAGMELRLP